MIPALRNVADSEASRMSAPSGRHIPPPYAGPLIAAMIGCGIARIAGTTSDMYSIARIAIRASVKPSLFGGTPTSSRFRPEQKPRPLPVNTTTDVVLSSPTSRSAS